MGTRRKGLAINIPFVDDSSGTIANGMSLGSPSSPPIIRISIPDHSINQDKDDRNEVSEEESDLKIKNEGGERDEPGKLQPTTSGGLGNRHRRNSISLPAGLENIEVIPPPRNEDTDDTYSEPDESEYNTDIEESKACRPSRIRKKSVMPPRNMENMDALELPEPSPGNSITSVNSIASLLKEKLNLITLPGLHKTKRKPKNYKLKAFVALLFLTIIFLVVFAYVFYHQQVLQRAYFERIRFNNQQRVVRVFDKLGNVLLQGMLGTTINSDLVFDCLPEDRFNDGSVCMEWMHRARMYLRYRQPSEGVRCYQVTWQSLHEDLYPTDCFDWLGEDGHWYGGGQTPNMTWSAKVGGTVPMSPFVTGDVANQQWGNVIRRYFLNSRGVGITIDSKTPLYVSIDNLLEGGKQLCIRAKNDDFAYFYRSTLLPQLNYSICASSDINNLHRFLSEKSLWDGLKETDISTINSLLTEPVWQISSRNLLNEATVYNYTEDVIASGYLGHVLINEFWQKNVGDLQMDVDRFPTMIDTIKVLRRRGFQVVLTIQPFISTESSNFKEAVKEKLLVMERGSSTIPALTSYKNILSAGVLDITKNQSIPWLQEKLLNVVKKYNVNSFFLDLGSSFNMPHFYRFETTLNNIDDYKLLFINAVLQQVPIMGVSSAVTRPKPPIFVSLPPLPSTWESLGQIIPTVLTYGVIGYPFIMPGPVGGDYYTETVLANYTHIYIKSVENALLTKTASLFPPSSTKKSTTTDTPPHEEDKKIDVFEELLEDTETLSTQSSIPVSKEDQTKVKVDPLAEKVESLLFSKEIEVDTAVDILREMANSNYSDVVEKASAEFPGDVMMSDQAMELVFLPDKELYIRWLQLSYFLPVIRFTYLPSKFKDETILETANYYKMLRRKSINPLLEKYAKEALDSGLPIIRPLWMLDPDDPICHSVVDEFSIGEELIVAPVLHPSIFEREVYLPAGVWKDGIDGSLRKGSRWIHHYRVPLQKIAYFVKMPDNTRF